MIDLVIPLGKGSKWNDNELRYSLRSVEKHLKGIRDVYIVGECPDWLQNVNHVRFEETGHASQNIMEKFLIASSIDKISDNFMAWNDDLFLRTDIDAETYPYKNGGPLQKYIKNTGDWYNEYLIETKNRLQSSVLPTFNFDVHAPIIYNKTDFTAIMSYYDFNEKLLVKSIYCNSKFIRGEPFDDCKIRSYHSTLKLYEAIEGRELFSIGDSCLLAKYGNKSSVKVFLQEMFPHKSKYEK